MKINWDVNWMIPLVMGVFFVVMMTLIWMTPSNAPDEGDMLVAICHDGSRIYTRSDNTSYAMRGHRPVADPKTVCR